MLMTSFISNSCIRYIIKDVIYKGSVSSVSKWVTKCM